MMRHTQVTGGSNYGSAPQLPMPPSAQQQQQQPRATYPALAPSGPSAHGLADPNSGGHARTHSGAAMAPPPEMQQQQQMVVQQYGRYAPQPVGAGGGYQDGGY